MSLFRNTVAFTSARHLSKTVRERYASSVIWQVISFMFGSLGFIIYTPYLAASKSQYGIYSVVTGLTLYAGLFDFGFGRVGTRVGAELVGCGELEKATRVIAYSGFLSFISALVVSILVLIIAFYPDTLLSGLALSQDRSLAFGMLVLLAVSLPVNAWNNIMVACYSVRMEESIVFRFVALGNFLKLIFFVLFFMNHESNPLAYYMMIQCFNFFITLFVSVIAFRRYRLFNLSFHRHFRFSFDFFLEHRKFAFGFYAGSVIVLLALYSEMPLISRLLGVHAAGDYAIGLSLSNYFTGVLTAMLFPLSTRLSNLRGANDIAGMRELLNLSFNLFLPFSFIFVFAFTPFLRPFIGAWVGRSEDVIVRSALIIFLSSTFFYLYQILGILLTVNGKIRESNLLWLVMVIILLPAATLFSKLIGIESFAYAKLLMMAIALCVYSFFGAQFMNLNILTFLRQYVFSGVLPALLSLVLGFALCAYAPDEKGVFNLIIVIFLSLFSFSMGSILFVIRNDRIMRFLSSFVFFKKYFRFLVHRQY